MSNPTFQGKRLADWNRELNDRRPAAHKAAAKALAAMGEPAVAALAEAVKDKRLKVARPLAASLLMNLGAKAEGAAGALADALEDDDDVVRLRAAQALAAIEPGRQDTLAALKTCLKSNVDFVRQDAATILDQIAPQIPHDTGDAPLSAKQQTQKVVTFFLHDNCRGGNYGDPKASPLFDVTEHLNAYLADGWRVTSIDTLGGAGGKLSGWVIVVLDRRG